MIVLYSIILYNSIVGNHFIHGLTWLRRKKQIIVQYILLTQSAFYSIVKKIFATTSAMGCFFLNTWSLKRTLRHYNDVIMSAIASQITSLTIVYSIVYLDADQTKHQSSASLAFVRGNNRGPVNSPHRWPVTRKMFPFHDVIMIDKMRSYW